MQESGKVTDTASHQTTASSLHSPSAVAPEAALRGPSGAKKSRTALKQALLQLMKKKPLSKITVKELSKEAGLNRSTFYANYNSLQELLFDIHTDLFHELSPDLMEIRFRLHADTPEGRIAAVTEILTCLKDNLDILSPLFMNNESNLFEKHLSEYYLEKYAFKNTDRGKRDVLFYHLMGSFSVVHQWIAEQCPCPPRELALLICRQLEGAVELT